jgi:TIR domain/Putative transposase
MRARALVVVRSDSLTKPRTLTMPNERIKNFFISYNRADRSWAEWVAWHLEEAGYTTVLQAWDFRPGSNFAVDMQRATSVAERTIAILSPDYLASSFTQPEWAAAFARDPTGENGLLLPVLVRDCDPIGMLRQIEGEVTFRWKDYADGNAVKEMTLDAREFTRRFLLHILPRGFVRIRHYGLLANRCRNERLERCRKLLGHSANQAASMKWPVRSRANAALIVSQIFVRCAGKVG